MPFSIVRNDLANVRADALVLPANDRLIIDGGTGYAVAKKAGLWRVRRACKRIGGCPVGSAVSTSAFSLEGVRYLIHAAGPIWGMSDHDEQLLRSTYDAALNLAAKLDCESVALPLISARSNGCPREVSLAVALDAIEAFIADHELRVTLVLYGREAMRLGLAEFGEIEQFIDDNYVDEHVYFGNSGAAYSAAPAASYPPPEAGAARSAPARSKRYVERRREDAFEMFDASVESLELGAPVAKRSESVREESLESQLAHVDAGFSETLLKLIDERGLKDPEIYKRANVSRQHFSKIRNEADYRPTKATAIALALALELDLPELSDLIGRAGYTLTHASKSDVIIEWFVTRGIYNIMKINEALYAFDQPLLG